MTSKLEEYKQFDAEIDRLIICYQHASLDDKRVVWAVLNKYAPYVPDFITDSSDGLNKA